MQCIGREPNEKHEVSACFETTLVNSRQDQWRHKGNEAFKWMGICDEGTNLNKPMIKEIERPKEYYQRLK